MNKEDIAYCGLNCELCKSKFAEIRQKINILEEAFEKVNIEEITKAIPFMKFKY
jgi:organic radical activating enzyme